MIRWIVLVLAIVGVSAAIPLVMSLQPTPAQGGGVRHPVADAVQKGPTAKVFLEGNPEHDFGQMAQFAHGKQDYVVKNVGEIPLEVRAGSSTCMCTVANFKDDKKSLSLAPGESTTITITWDTKENSGAFEKKVSIETSDPVQPELWFTVKGKVYPAIITAPQDLALNFGDIESNSGHPARVAMYSADKPDFKILKMTPTHPELVNVTSRDLTTEEKAELNFPSGYRVDIELKPSPEVGTFAEEIVVATDHPNRPEMRIPLRGKRIGPISTAPERLRIEADSSNGGRQSAMILVRGQQSTAFEIAEKPAGIEVTIDPIAPASADDKVRRYKLTATIPAGVAPSVINGEILLKTDHPAVATFKLPISAVILGAR